MAYLAIYRKYRPKSFDEVVGQNYVTQILKNQILSDRIGHAYLLSGIRGTGKTSIAKIFARAINCVNNTDGNPCNECDVCKEIDNPGLMDIIEIDAASNRGVDEIRDIRENVKYPPKIGKYKVYIIDEVHMMTKEAFNALLKTLEEPPKHAVFILATTEPEKLPATILSRCQRFEIKPISQEMLVAQMQYITDDLNIKIEPAALEIIARRGDHSMRDSLSLLDQIIDIGRGDAVITEEDVISFLGMSDRESLNGLIKGVFAKDSAKVVTYLDRLRQKGTDPLLLMGQIIDYCRELLIVMMAENSAGDVLGLTENEITERGALCEGISSAKIFKMIDSLIEDRQKLRYNDLASVILEMALLKLCMSETEEIQQREVTKTNKLPEKTPVIRSAPKKEVNLQSEISSQSEKIKSDEPTESIVSFDFNEDDAVVSTDTPVISPEKNVKTEKVSHSGGNINTDKIYRAIHNSLGPLLANFLMAGKLKQVADNKLVLEFESGRGEAAYNMLKDQKLKMAEIVQSIAGSKVAFDLIIDKKNNDSEKRHQMNFEEKVMALGKALNVDVVKTNQQKN